MRIDPATGQDLDDPEIQAALAAQAAQAPASPLLAMERPPAPAGVPAFGAVPAYVPPLAPEPAPPPPEAVPALPATPPPPAPVVPKPAKHGGGGGGGAAAALPPSGTETAREAVARGTQKTAQEGELEVQQRATDTGVQKAEAVAAQDAAEAQQVAQQQDAAKARIGQANDYLQQRQAERSKMQVRDLFEGRPGVAVAAALLEGLGAGAATMTGGPNMPMQTIDKAAESYRRSQLDKLDLKNMDVADAKEALHNAHLEVAADEAGMYKRLAAQRAAAISKFGGDEARVAGDKLYQELNAKAADKELSWQTGLQQRGEKQLNDIAERKLKGAETARAYAGAAKERAEAGTAGAPKGDRAASHKIDLGIFGSGVVDQIKEANELKLSPKEMAAALDRVQTNETRLKSADHATGVLGTLGVVAGRSVGVVPKARTDGLSARQTQWINKLDIAQKKVATVLAGQGRANSHEMMEAMRPQPSDDPETIRKKLLELAAIGESAKAEAGQYGDISAEAIRRTKEAGNATSAGGGADIEGAKTWLRSPAARADPVKAAKWMKRLKELGAL